MLCLSVCVCGQSSCDDRQRSYLQVPLLLFSLFLFSATINFYFRPEPVLTCPVVTLSVFPPQLLSRARSCLHTCPSFHYQPHLRILVLTSLQLPPASLNKDLAMTLLSQSAQSILTHLSQCDTLVLIFPLSITLSCLQQYPCRQKLTTYHCSYSAICQMCKVSYST